MGKLQRLVSRMPVVVFVLLLLINSFTNAQSLNDLLRNLYGKDDLQPAASNSVPQYSEPSNGGAIPLSTSYHTDPRFNAQLSETIATNVLDLAHDVGRTVLAAGNTKTAVFSPISIYSALSLLLLGANGRTFDELLQLMRLDKDNYLAQNPWKIHEEMGLLLDDLTRNSLNPNHPRSQHNWKVNRGPVSSAYRNELGDYKISVANGLFVQTGYSLRPDYRSAVLGTYKSNMQNLDFEHNLSASVNYINNWVNEKTEGRISEIVSDQLSPQTRVVLASALYFNAKWEKTFIESITGPKDFFPDGLSNPAITVQMMGNGGIFPYYDSKEFDCSIIGLPYKHNMTTMFIILPNNSNRERLRQMQEYLTADRIESMIARMEWKTAIVLLPKMHITNEMKMKELFQRMGLSDLFEPARSDLSLISEGFGGAAGYAPQQEAINKASYAPPPSINQASYAPPSPSINGPDLRNPFVSSLADDEEIPFIFSRHGEENEDQEDEKDHKHILSSSSSITFEASESESNSSSSPFSTRPRTNEKSSRSRRSVSYKVPSEGKVKESPLRLKDYIISKRIIKPNPGKKNIRTKRHLVDQSQSLKQLDGLRNQLRSLISNNPGLFAEEIVHKVDLTVNEKGTEGGAATVTTLYRTGTDVVMRVETPFMFLIRHDDTRLPLFYGAVYEP